jgi:hypothetical protein
LSSAKDGRLAARLLSRGARLDVHGEVEKVDLEVPADW